MTAADLLYAEIFANNVSISSQEDWDEYNAYLDSLASGPLPVPENEDVEEAVDPLYVELERLAAMDAELRLEMVRDGEEMPF